MEDNGLIFMGRWKGKKRGERGKLEGSSVRRLALRLKMKSDIFYILLYIAFSYVQ
jgi:hypothetical protein